MQQVEKISLQDTYGLSQTLPLKPYLAILTVDRVGNIFLDTLLTKVFQIPIDMAETLARHSPTLT